MVHLFGTAASEKCNRDACSAASYNCVRNRSTMKTNEPVELELRAFVTLTLEGAKGRASLSRHFIPGPTGKETVWGP
jgi:hypothetical protein